MGGRLAGGRGRRVSGWKTSRRERKEGEWVED